ncbi:T9SS type A sorting domain-containing protein [Flavobacterium tructae]|uniref:DUF7619 domain-containing protein n=1 Tax=Flavobacterium tructae TaxID=1114873 RepID=UPI0035A8568D
MKQLYLLIHFFLFSIIYSQNPATIDLSYDYTDQNLFLNGNVFQSAILPNGQTVIIGNFTGYQLQNQSVQKTGNIIKLNSDLSHDKSFDLSTRLKGTANSIAAQSTGKILIAGNIDSYDGKVLNTPVIRVNIDGSLDTTFPKVFFSSVINKIQVDSKDKIYITSGKDLARLDPNGGYDSSYTVGSSFPELIQATTTSADGSIFIAGGFFSWGELKVYKTKPDGNIDHNFSNGTNSFNCSIATLALQSDGKLLVGGSFGTFGGTSVDHLLRLNPDGTLDPSFSCPDITGNYLDYCKSIRITFVVEQPDKKILVGGIIPAYNGAPARNLIRLNSDGSLDKTFVTGTGTDAQINSITIRPNGNLFVCASNISPFNEYVPLAYNNYSIGTFFELDKNGTLLHREKSSLIDAKKIIKGVNGQFNIIGESRSPYHRGLKTINNNGTLSVNTNLFRGFDNKLKGWSGNPKASSCKDGVLQPDGKMILVGDFDTYNDVVTDGLVRLNNDYSIDTSFNVGKSFTYPGSDPEIHSVALQSDGKILVGGYFDSYRGTPVKGKIIRLNKDGSLDTTFNFVSELFSTAPRQIEIQTDGKIIINVGALERLHSDGTLDDSYNPDSEGPGYFAKFSLLPDGKVLIPTRTKIIKVNKDGSTDTSFNSGEFNRAAEISFAIQPDGKILCAGEFFSYNGKSINGLLRLNGDGTLDSGFDIGTGFNGEVTSVFIDSDGKILVAGLFNNYNGVWCNGSVKLLGENAFLVRGQNKFDSNNDGCDESDFPFTNSKLTIVAGSITTEMIANDTGSYNIPLPSGKHTITPKLENPSYFNVEPKNTTVDFPTQTSPLISNFCVTPNGMHPDLEIVIIPLDPARPGFQSKYKILLKNKGNQLQSGSIILTFDNSLISIVSTNPSASNKTANTLKWNFNNLQPFHANELSINVLVNKPTDIPPANSGTILKYTAQIQSSSKDDTPNDNTFNFNHVVVNSFDPNDKTCLEGTTIQSSKIGEYVHYLIRFENTGTYKAQNITVKDIIDINKFDISTLIPQTGSHLFTTKISEGNKVEFLFEGINLPFDDANNDGYLVFKIKTKSTLKAGDELSNSSSIYFDYNPAIITNTAITKIESNLSNQDFSLKDTFSIYPNPVVNILSMSQTNDIEINSLSIYNVLGQLVLIYPNAKNMTSIDVSNLPSGSYFMKVNSNRGSSNITFIKK